VQTWAVVVVAALTTVARLTSDLVALRRHRARHGNLESLVAKAAHGLHLVYRDADGAIVDITITGLTDAARPVLSISHWPGE
jgi:hypothetical protein